MCLQEDSSTNDNEDDDEDDNEDVDGDDRDSNRVSAVMIRQSTDFAFFKRIEVPSSGRWIVACQLIISTSSQFYLHR